LQGADLSGAQLQGADLSGAQLQGADFSGANMADSELSYSFTFRTGISNADLATVAIRSIEADKFKFDFSGKTPLADADVKSWIRRAKEFAQSEDEEHRIDTRIHQTGAGFSPKRARADMVGNNKANVCVATTCGRTKASGRIFLFFPLATH
jgi:hypothetical protein